jgi:UDP-glucose 4-epimerase
VSTDSLNYGVVGAKGFLGRNLVSFLENQEKKVSKFTSIDPIYSDGILNPEVADVNCLVWVASIVNPITAENDYDKIEKEIETWKESIRLLEKMPKPPRIIFISSGGCVYSDSSYPVSETSPAQGINNYGKLKLIQESILQTSKLSNTILRVSNVYGPNQPTGRGQGVIAEWAKSALSNKPLKVIGSLETLRDFVYLDDLNRAILASSTSKFSGVLNIGSGIQTKLSDVIHELEIAIGRTLELEHLSSRHFDRKAYSLDINRALTVINWKPQVPLSEGIHKTIKLTKLAK